MQHDGPMDDAWDDETWDEAPRRRLGDLQIVVGLVAVLIVAALLGRSTQPAETSEPSTEQPGASSVAQLPVIPPPAAQPESARWLAIRPAPFAPDDASEGVWTGSRMLVWDHSDTGRMYAYHPREDVWERFDRAPGRVLGGHAMIWTGDEVIIWGGRDLLGVPTADGYRFSPATGWEKLPIAPLEPRVNPGMAWDPVDRRVVIWGGDSVTTSGPDRFLADGATFEPATNRWKELPVNAMAGRASPTVAAVSGGMAIVGGVAGPVVFHDGVLLEGGFYHTIPPPPTLFDGPTPFIGTSASGLVTWGQPTDFSDPAGYRWRPASGWEPLPRLLNQERSRPDLGVREEPGGGSLLVVWGGLERRGVERVTDGFWLHLPDGRWRAFPPAPISARSDTVVVATAEQLLVWGGRSGGTVPVDGARLGLPPRS